MNESLPILWQDDDVVVIKKPAGILVHRTPLDSRESVAIVQLLRDQLGKKVFPVHRLDRPTSGALILALNSESARNLAEQFQNQSVKKIYWALVRGRPPDEGRIDHPLREELDRIADQMANFDKEPQQAQTLFRRLHAFEIPICVDRYPNTWYSLVEAIPLTGRKHQIRRHLRHLGHPVIGDVNHGSGKHNRFFSETFGFRRLLLACTEISFQHPRTQSLLQVTAPLCDDFQAILKHFLHSPGPILVEKQGKP